MNLFLLYTKFISFTGRGFMLLQAAWTFQNVPIVNFLLEYN